jgi:uncharacterized Zn finger protein
LSYDSYGGWARYVPVAERKMKAAKLVKKLRQKGQSISPIEISGRAIATTFWGKSWNKNLESYSDAHNRLERGRTYVRNGSVIDLKILPMNVKAMVNGSSMYTTTISIEALDQSLWQGICEDCSGEINSLVELLQGKLSKAVMERVCSQTTGLFPKSAEISFHCSCPDGAEMCKHVAAVLYGIGARLDTEPELLFRLRDVDENALVADINQAFPASNPSNEVEDVLEADDISGMFGIEIADPDEK